MVMQGLGDFFQNQYNILFPLFPEISLSSQWRDCAHCVSTWASTIPAIANASMPCSSPGTCRAKSQLPTWQGKSVTMLVTVNRSEKIPTKVCCRLVYFDGNFSTSSPYSILKAAQSGTLPVVRVRPQSNETSQTPKKKGCDLPLAPQ